MQLLNGLASVELPPLKSDTEIYSVSCGLQLAVQTMCECSELQHEYRTSLNENTPPVIKVVDFVKHTFFCYYYSCHKEKKTLLSQHLIRIYCTIYRTWLFTVWWGLSSWIFNKQVMRDDLTCFYLLSYSGQWSIDSNSKSTRMLPKVFLAGVRVWQ